MFDIGFFELLLIGIVGLLVLGPERLPRAARTAGLWVGRIKRSVSTMQREITSQLEAEELRQKLAEQQKKLDENVNQARRSVEKHFESGEKRDNQAPSASSAVEPHRVERPAPAASDDASSAPHDASPADKDSASR
ncbi:Sec-independent protein translocase protein TatB [Salinicola acroporae]|uniref:Sec-independent protein translocase protein TatB n=1 Tax=Salinicola acroporae TaxID=1541440 RepID=A0ABT6I909_9GAMM|nr:Sec-independent protein translocase protein TatB [Salinicola acroporae]MDH4574188.1 twin-arginine translocase subunit TatB [Salinicola acroporae]